MLKVSVISPEAVLFEGEATSVVAPAFDGEVGILTGHAPMMTLLGKGRCGFGWMGGRMDGGRGGVSGWGLGWVVGGGVGWGGWGGCYQAS